MSVEEYTEPFGEYSDVNDVIETLEKYVDETSNTVGFEFYPNSWVIKVCMNGNTYDYLKEELNELGWSLVNVDTEHNPEFCDMEIRFDYHSSHTSLRVETPDTLTPTDRIAYGRINFCVMSYGRYMDMQSAELPEVVRLPFFEPFDGF
jgi:hypothetical protein